MVFFDSFQTLITWHPAKLFVTEFVSNDYPKFRIFFACDTEQNGATTQSRASNRILIRDVKQRDNLETMRFLDKGCRTIYLYFWPCSRYLWWTHQSPPSPTPPDPTRPWRSLTDYFSKGYFLKAGWPVRLITNIDYKVKTTHFLFHKP